MAHSLRNLIALVIIAVSVSASKAETPAPVPVRQVTLEFAAAARNAPDGIGYSPLPGKPLKPVMFYGGSRAEPQTYRGDAVVKFYDTSASAGPQLVATCTVPEGMRSVLFLFIPLPVAETGPKYTVVAVDDSLKQLPMGTFAIINSTNKEYVASFGASPISIHPGVSTTYPSTGNTALQLAVANGAEWRQAGRHDFAMSNRSRGWVIIYPPERVTSTYPVIRSLIDEIAPPAATQTLARFP